MKSNRMRNIHSYLTTKYGKEIVEIYRRWEKYEYKMADFQNHRRFSLRCLSNNIIPTSVRLKSTIRTPKAKYIIHRAEKALLNERIRSITNTISMFKILRDTCISQLEEILNSDLMEECRTFIEVRRERRHLSTLERHISKFRRLCHEKSGGRSNPRHDAQRKNSGNTCITACNQTTATTTTTITDTSRSTSNPLDICDNWVRNMSRIPLTKAEKSLLGHGPNFVMIPKNPPTCDYIATTEKACQNLSQGKAEELRGEIKQLLMAESYHQAKHPQRRVSSIKTVEERQQQDGPNCR